MSKSVIEVKIVIDGSHHYPDAPQEVSFLKSLHRHQFFIRCQQAVSHQNREIEFFVFKRKLIAYLTCYKDEFGEYNFGAMSCEMIATELVRAFNLVACSVHEDDENGAIVTA